jgi:hypothetical protein
MIACNQNGPSHLAARDERFGASPRLMLQETIEILLAAIKVIEDVFASWLFYDPGVARNN